MSLSTICTSFQNLALPMHSMHSFVSIDAVREDESDNFSKQVAFVTSSGKTHANHLSLVTLDDFLYSAFQAILQLHDQIDVAYYNDSAKFLNWQNMIIHFCNDIALDLFCLVFL